MSLVYLDHNASSPLDPRVLEAMRPHWLASGNPESRHSAGRTTRRTWQDAKAKVAHILGASEDEVIFTSGGTEANNLAVLSLAHREGMGTQIITSPLEHPAVAEPIARLGEQGFLVEQAEVNHEGITDVAAMAAAIRSNTQFATLMLANNETGAIQPVEHLAQLAAQRGIPVHTDAVQAVGRIAVNFHALGVASLAAGCHKFHGPPGIGVLLLARNQKCKPLLFGGRQQQGCRPGTPPVALAVGMATALELWQAEATERGNRWKVLRDRLETSLVTALGRERVIRNGPGDPSKLLPQTLNLGFAGVDGDSLLMQLDLAGVCVSLGAACASGSTQPSPSLLAMRVPADRIRSSVRFSFGALTTEADIDRAAFCVISAITKVPH